MLLTFLQIDQGLKSYESSMPTSLPRSQFAEPNITSEDVSELEARLNITLPKSFSDLLSKYNFGD